LEEVKRLNETHRPQPLPDEVLAELDRILAAAEREVGRAVWSFSRRSRARQKWGLVSREVTGYNLCYGD